MDPCKNKNNSNSILINKVKKFHINSIIQNSQTKITIKIKSRKIKNNNNDDDGKWV